MHLRFSNQSQRARSKRLFNWLHQLRQTPELLRSKAIAYTQEREDNLKVFLANPNVPLDTNRLEWALRVTPMARKNYSS